MYRPPSSTLMDRQRILPTAEEMDQSHVPSPEDNTYNRLRLGEYEWPDRRTTYGYIKVKRPPDEVLEGGFATHRANNNYANLAKFAGKMSDTVEDSAIGTAAGAGAGRFIAQRHVAEQIGKLKFLNKLPSVQRGINRFTGKGALVGAGVGALTGLMKPTKKANENPEGHAFITDVGVTTLPKKLGPSELSHAFHMQNPVAKYYPVMGTVALGGGSVLADLAFKKKVNGMRALVLSTTGSGLGTLGKIFQEDAFMKPYKKDYIRRVEHKYHTKMGGEAVNEYITETNLEVLPFHGTTPEDLDTAYRFKHPIANYATGLGTLAGAGGYMAHAAIRKAPLRLTPALIAGTIAGGAASVLSQLHKDISLNRYKKPYVSSVTKEYRGLK